MYDLHSDQFEESRRDFVHVIVPSGHYSHKHDQEDHGLLFDLFHFPQLVLSSYS